MHRLVEIAINSLRMRVRKAELLLLHLSGLLVLLG